MWRSIGVVISIPATLILLGYLNSNGTSYMNADQLRQHIAENHDSGWSTQEKHHFAQIQNLLKLNKVTISQTRDNHLAIRFPLISQANINSKQAELRSFFLDNRLPVLTLCPKQGTMCHEIKLLPNPPGHGLTFGNSANSFTLKGKYLHSIAYGHLRV